MAVIPADFRGLMLKTGLIEQDIAWFLSLLKNAQKTRQQQAIQEREVARGLYGANYR